MQRPWTVWTMMKTLCWRVFTEHVKWRIGSSPNLPNRFLSTSRTGLFKGLTADQISKLEDEFRCNHYLTRSRRMELANSLKLSEKTIKQWFQRRRLNKRKEIKEGLTITVNPALEQEFKRDPKGFRYKTLFPNIDQSSSNEPAMKTWRRRRWMVMIDKSVLEMSVTLEGECRINDSIQVGWPFQKWWPKKSWLVKHTKLFERSPQRINENSFLNFLNFRFVPTQVNRWNLHENKR